MQFGGSLVLIAIGAVLRWGVTYRVNGVNVPTIGLILIVVGVLGLVLTTMFWANRRRTAVVPEREVVTPTVRDDGF